MQTKENILVSDKERKETNVWDRFFLQPGGVKFSEIKKEKNVIILENPRSLDRLEYLLNNEASADYWRTVCERFIAFSEEEQKIIDKNISWFNTKERWLGVLARGTDYLNTAVGHSNQPGIKDLEKEINIIREKYECNKIFLATEDADILDGLKSVY